MLEGSNQQSPIIIMGMHRSGTSLVTRLIENLGVFLGNDLDRNHESNFFKSINEKLIRDAGGNWDNPKPIKWLFEDVQIRNCYFQYIKDQINSHQKFKYLGYFKRNSMNNIWGWKDPRNTFTAPIWRDIYPKSKMIIVERHGLDVALSLIKRRQEYLRYNQALYKKRKNIYQLFGKRGTFVDSIRCHNIINSINLWHEYALEARMFSEKHDNTFTINYENLLTNPLDTIISLANFLEIPPPKNIPFEIDKSKSNSYQTATNGSLFTELELNEVRTKLESLGYKF
jgi:hypothetical protein